MIYLILAFNRFKIDFHTVDVLSDEAIRSGVKDFSQWPTIPQLYVCGEFVGGMFYMLCFFDLRIYLYLVGCVLFPVCGKNLTLKKGTVLSFYTITTKRIRHYDRTIPKRRVGRDDRESKSRHGLN